LSQAS
jgi:hypothetical protein